MKSNNDKKWTVADVLTNFGKVQAQVQQEKQLKQQLKEALMQNQAQALGQFVPGMEQQMPPMEQDMSLDQSYEQAKQGGIHIDPSKKGTFKAQATRMGMGIQEAAEYILSNKDSYSSGMVRKANFARNFAKEEGGTINNPGFNALPKYVQENILSNMEYGGDYEMDQYKNGGYTVRRSNDRKGKTHVVIGPDGTKKYFGDPNMGERGKSKYGKDAFYARHADSLKKNPYFRAYARATWEDGGEMMQYAGGGEMIKRADGSYSQRGLWDNIRDNAGSGNEPTREMIEQERKIRKKAMGGMMGPSDCEEGFTWNDTYQTCVPIGQEIIDPQTGENYLKDWYSKRLNVINNPGYAEAVGAENVKGQTKFLNQVVPLANEQLSNYVPTEYVDEIEGMPNATGEYVDYDRETPVINIKRSSVVNPIDFAATQVHEGSTYANQKAWDKFLTPTQNRIIEQNTKPWETFLKDNTTIDKSNKNAVRELEDAYDYSTNPQQDNVHSNVHATRYLFNLLPDEIITEDKIKSMIEEGNQKGYLDRSSPNYHDDFYRLLKLSRDNKSLVNLFNLLASDDAGLSDNDLQMAKHGGNIGNLRKFF
jgi:hypothetical protein